MSETSGISFASLLFLLFLGLKLAGVIAWSGWWVLAPIWVPALFVLVVILVMLIAAWVKAGR
jgi:hypothetical protein